VEAVGAMQVLLRDAVHPNLVQSLEGTPAFVHGGPFANIAQGTNSALSTRLALKLADFVVTEAGFATDLGAEKFVHLKCRTAGLRPSAAVIVATAKAVEYHGGSKAGGGLANLAKHIENVRLLGMTPVVALNRFDQDSVADLKRIVRFCARHEVEAVVSTHFQDGGKGAEELAQSVLRATSASKAKPRFLYPIDAPLRKKLGTLARRIYGADRVEYDRRAMDDLALLERHGFDRLPVCVAKTPLSLSDDPKLRGRPRGFSITVNELRVSAGAGFVVAVCGNIVTMPGLPKVPAAARIKMLPNGQATGLS
jgi:formate--tetrahydrofolate ligase